MKKLIVVLTFLGLLVAATLYADTPTSTTTWVTGQNVKVVKVSWATTNLSVSAYANIDEFNGFVMGVITDPTGTVEANYDIYLRDYVTDVSLLGTSLENRSATASEFVNFGATNGVPSYGPVGFSLTGAGDLEAGDVYFYIQVPK